MDYILSLNIVEQAILGVLALALLIQLAIYIFLYFKILFYKEEKSKVKEQFPVSIVICAKNEAAKLEKFLPSVLEQDYPDFEVIVVDDGSDDGTEDILKLLKNKYSKLYVTTIPQSQIKHNKKLAISIGLKAAKHSWVLLTDADCWPVSNQWLKQMQEKFDKNVDFVIGYGGYEKRKGLLNRIIRYDTLIIAMQYFTMAMAKKTYMGVGRNLAYRKSVFFDNSGFANHLHLASGDDDLFVNENATKDNVKVALQPESFTRSVSKKKFKEWLYQKKRHLTTFKYYKKKHRFILGLEVKSRVLFYAAFIAGLCFPGVLFIVLAAFLLRLIVQLFPIYNASVRFQEKGVFYLYILFDILIPIINFMVHFGNIKLRKRKK